MKKKLDNLLEKSWVSYTVAACIAVVLYILLTKIYLVGEFLRFLSPVLWGVVIAYVLNPLVNTIEKALSPVLKKEKIRHAIAVILSLLVVTLAVIFLLITILPPMVKSISNLIENVEDYASNLHGYLVELDALASKANLDISHFLNVGENIIQEVADYVSSNADTIASTFFDVGMSIVNLVIGIVIAVYFMFGKKKICANINRVRKLILKEKNYNLYNIFWAKCNDILSQFIIFDIVDGIIIGVANAVFMLICSMPNVALISVVIGVTNMVPTFGPIVGALIGALILLLTKPMDAFLFIIFTIIAQAVDGSIIKPKLFGENLGVPAVWIFIAIVLGGKALGVLGILLAIPLVAIVSYVVREILMPRLESRSDTGDTGDRY